MTIYKKEHIKVDELHELYVEYYGNKKGLPVIYIHGGPGDKINYKCRKFFNLKKFNVILYDQRGCGKSKPKGLLKNNTTSHLIDDIEKIRIKNDIKKLILFGGSWGATLAVLYAQKYPKNVHSMVLRGFFLPSENYDKIINDTIQNIYSDLYDTFLINKLKTKKEYLDYYSEKIFNNKNKKESKEFLKKFIQLEFSILKLKPNLNYKLNYESDYNYVKIYIHYLKNNYFLEKNHIIKNIKKIEKIKTNIVHGRYDVICPLKQSWIFHKNMKNSKIFICNNSGHSKDEIEITKKLKEIMNKY